VQGQFNATSSVLAAFIVGNGTDDSNRSNLIHAAGNTVEITGSLNVSGSIVGLITNATSASYALTASHALNSSGGTVDTSSLTTTSSFNAYTSSINTYTSSINTYTSSINSYTSSINNRTGSFILTSSFAAYTASINGWTGSVVTTSSFVSFSSSINSFTSSINTYTASINARSSSFATTGSNSFNGNQNITGSLTVSSLTTISSSLTANTSSLFLTSGSNFYLQNNGSAEITGSLLVTGSVTITSGSITMPNRPAFRVTGVGGAKVSTTVLSGSYLNVDYQQGSGWDNSTGTFTSPIAGLYQVNVVVRTNSNSLAGISQLIVFKNNTSGTNGTPQIMVEFGANTTMNHTGGSTISKLAIGDTLKMVVSAGEISFDANDNFSVAYIG
jgi:hypothetical protein